MVSATTKKRRFELVASHETMPCFWYLCGAAEDVYLGVDEVKGTYEFDLDSASEPWLRQIQPIIKKLIDKDVAIKPHSNREHFRLRFWHKQLVLELQRVKNDAVDVVRAIDARLQQNYVAGFFDAEGTATCTGSRQPQVSMYSTDLEKLEFVKEILENNGVKSGIYHPKHRNVRQLYVSGRGTIRTFATVFPIRHPAKRKRIHELLHLRT